MSVRPRLLHLLSAAALALVMLASGFVSASAEPTWTGESKEWAMPKVRAESPEDRFAMARGCYLIASEGNSIAQGTDGTYTVGDAGEPFFFQATDLGSYLLYDSSESFLAANEGALAEALNAARAAGVTVPDGPWGSGGEVKPGEIVGGVSAEHVAEIVQYEHALGHAGLDDADDEFLPAESTDEAADELSRSEANQGRAESVVAAADPSPLADWIVEGPEGGPFRFVLPLGENRSEKDPSDGGRDRALDVELAIVDGGLTLVESGAGSDFDLILTEGCAVFPEIDVNVDGPVVGGQTSFQEVRGMIDLHLHGMAFEFIGGRSRCGRPWHRYGVAFALKDCADHEPGGFGAVLEGVLSNGSPDGRHNTDGWPTFEGWPVPGSLTHEQVYYRWLERAWRGGLRLATNLLVDNNQLCKLYPYKRNSCNEMDGVRLQAQRLEELERYIDAQSGGPGEGWFRIVKTPLEAREVINDGKLAVVMGIEVSRLFDCSSHPAAPKCTPEIVEERLQEAYDLGVRQMELVNKFDNQFSGVTGDSGSAGPVVNIGNFGETGSWYRLDDCESFHEENPHSHGASDKQHTNVHDDAFDGAGQAEPFTGRDGIFAAVIDTVHEHTGTPLNPAPIYPGGPHCNRVGLTELGKVLITKMAEKGIIFDPDHMSIRARYAALDFYEDIEGDDPDAKALYENPKFHGLPYSGVASSHSWSDDTVYQRIYKLGGVVTPAGDDAEDFVHDWEEHRTWYDDRYFNGFGFGSDTNGFSAHGGPSVVAYPFEDFGGATFERQYSGPAAAPGEEPIGKTYDLNTDGVSHYGLFADWFESGRLLAEHHGEGKGQLFYEDMLRGAESYLQMWERADGIAPNACRFDVPDLTDADLERLSVGMTPAEVLGILGQPNTRVGSTFTYCLGSRTGTLVFTEQGSLSEWGVGIETSPSPDDLPTETASPSPGETSTTTPTETATPTPSGTETRPPTVTPTNTGPGGGGGGPGGGGSQSPAEEPQVGTLSTSIAASDDKITYGGEVSLSGRLTAPRDCAGPFVIDVAARTYGTDTYAPLDSVTVGPEGSWTLDIAPESSSSYVATPRTAGACEGTASTPTDVLVKVKIRARLPKKCKRSASVRGSVSPDRPGTKVALQRRADSKWKKVDSAKLNKQSRFKLKTRFCDGRFRIVWKGPDVRNERGMHLFRLS